MKATEYMKDNTEKFNEVNHSAEQARETSKQAVLFCILKSNTSYIWIVLNKIKFQDRKDVHI